jgi:hypothetical protein
MHLRTAYLPEQGAPLVCRFEDQGREIVVEGLVAWRKATEKGGDFGVSFTALDSGSVDALRGLLRGGEKEPASSSDGSEGSRVRLHIEGLGSPMKARVRGGSGARQIQVGSSLEFLKVGRRLEVEDVEAGSRRAAQIDGVQVLINPSTKVPQLVVALRYEGAEDTPEPTTTDLGEQAPRAEGFTLAVDGITTDAGGASPETRVTASGTTDDAAVTEDDPEPSGDQPEAAEPDDIDAGAGVSATALAARRLGTAAENAGVLARDASLYAARWGVARLEGLGKVLGERVAAFRRGAPRRRRTTAPPPEGPQSTETRKLRSQSPKSDRAPAQTRRRVPPKHIAIGASAVVLLGAVTAMALRSGVAKEQAHVGPPAASAVAALAASGAPSPAPVTPSVPGAPVTANVPLFGPTPLATLEPAPLGPPPTGDAAAEEALELAAAQAATPAEADDEEFPDSPRSKPSKSAKKSSSSSAKRPEDVPPFGKGRLHLPTISRLRLDAPGTELRGVAEANGFTVLIPGRKLMEKGTAIARRDSRIARIRTTNTPGGAQIHLTFKENAPAYRVRLRRDQVELFISAPEKTATKSTSTKSRKR